jgi:hypothetical protein
MLGRLGNRCQPVDAADDLIAERGVLEPGAGRLHFTHAFPMTKAKADPKRISTDRYKFGASAREASFPRTIRLVSA